MSLILGKIHKYLVMNLDYTVSGIARISTLDYIDDILTAFEKMNPIKIGMKSGTSPENLFNVDEDCDNLSPYKSKGFHNLAAKTLYTTKRDIPDTCTSVAFLTTRVREPDTEDWKKLDQCT